ncbi:MAG: BREX-4 system phosphatase PglZ, partial [Clostridia bacterium]|nr:BREX-4 system phosphatase PglZ [Clostridia bacterium]
VNKYAYERLFYKLLPRSSVLSSMDRRKAQGFFFDALGVEYLSYIIAKCEQYGMIYEISIVRSELPSITVINDDYKQYFDTKNISELDELKHHSQIYDYQKCAYPIHIFRELEIIDRQLRLIRSQLIENDSFDRAVIISDHGASRLAVIYKHENQSQIQLDEKGEHSGRCCMANEDPNIPEAAYENGFAVLGNYDRFKGGRKANLEVHGGASLEEVVIPIITLSLRPENVEYYFVDPIIKYKATKPCEIVLFSNIPMKAPKICVEGIFYNGMFQGDHKHALFSMPELKRVRDYQAYVYDGNTNSGVVLTFSIERNTKQKNLF